MGKLKTAALALVLATPAFAQQQPSTVTNMPPASTPLSGNEIIYVIQNGVSKKTSLGDLTAIPSTPNIANVQGLGSGVLPLLQSVATGSGYLVGSVSPQLITPYLDTPSAVNLLHATNLPLTTGVTGVLPVANGGSGAATLTGPLFGNGVSAFTVGTLSGNTTQLATVTGSLTNGHCVSTDSNHNFVDSGGVCGGGGGSGTVTAGTINQVAYYSGTGTTVAGLSVVNNAVLVTSAGGVPSEATALPSAVQLNITSLGTVTAGVWNGTAIANANLANSTISGVALGSNLFTLTFGAHLTAGGASYNGTSGVTITSDATNANTASTIVARDGSGNFSAGTITASLTGHASLDLPLTGGTLSGALTVAGLTATGSFTATGLVTNADLVNAATTVNGQTCTLGSTCTITAAATSMTVGTTTVASGTTGYVLYDNAGTLANLGTTGTLSGGLVVLNQSPTLTTPTISGALTYGGVTLTANVTGTNKMVLSNSPSITSPTLNGTVTLGSTPVIAGSPTASGAWTFTGVISQTPSLVAPVGDGQNFLAQDGTRTAYSFYSNVVPPGWYNYDIVRSVVDNETSSVVNKDAYGAYIYNNLASGSGATSKSAVGLFVTAVNAATGATTWGINPSCGDSTANSVGTSQASTCIGAEFDFTNYNTGSVHEGVSAILQGMAQPSTANGFQLEALAANLLANPNSPVTQTTPTLATGTYTLAVQGSGSATMSAGSATGCGTGAATKSAEVSFTITVSGTCNITVAGGPSFFQLLLNSTTTQWTNGFVINDHAVKSGGYGIVIGTAGIDYGANVSSAPVKFASFDSAGTEHSTLLTGIPYGTNSALQITDANLANGIYLAPAATTGTPVIGAVGSDTNITLLIAGKGTGTVQMGSSVTPLTSLSYSLGTASFEWTTVYTENLAVTSPAGVGAYGNYAANGAANGWQIGSDTSNKFYIYDTNGSAFVMQMPSAGTLTITPKVALPGTTTGTPTASLCLDSSNNVIKKTTAGSCV